MARSFNGSSFLRADAASGYASTSALSIAFWFTGAGQTNFFMFSMGTSGTSTASWFGIGSADVGSNRRLHVAMRDTGGNLRINGYTTSTPLDSTWHHACYTQDGAGNYVLYVDGVVDISATHVTTGSPSTNELAIGGLVRNNSVSLDFTGSVEEVAWWRRKLSAADAISLAAGLLPCHLGPAHYWPLWGVDSPEPDIGIDTHTAGTLTGTSKVNGARVGRRLLTLA